jgi:hypothetical protein
MVMDTDAAAAFAAFTASVMTPPESFAVWEEIEPVVAAV